MNFNDVIIVINIFFFGMIDLMYVMEVIEYKVNVSSRGKGDMFKLSFLNDRNFIIIFVKGLLLFFYL